MSFDPTVLKLAAAVAFAAFLGLLLYAMHQYQTTERRWAVKLVLWLVGGALLVGLGTAACHWVVGLLYGLGYVLTWRVWVLTRRWSWWRQALARGLAAGLTLGPWLWLGATERAKLSSYEGGMATRLLTPNALRWFWLLLGVFWLLALVGGWRCWHWPVRPTRRRWLVATWAVLGVFGLNWYAAGRVDLLAACGKGQRWRLGYVLVSRPGSQWYRTRRGWTPIHEAATNGQIEVIRLLRAFGADVRIKTDDGSTPLHPAAAHGKAEPIRLLLAAGADVNARANDGDTPLQLAARYGRAAAIPPLLDAGADPNAKDGGGMTPLHWAAVVGHVEAIRMLLAAGASVNVKSKTGGTPMEWAAQAGKAETIRLLLKAGADPSAKDNEGRTPLFRASEHGRVEAIRTLLAAGATVNERDQAGRTPLHAAASRGQAEAIRILLSAGSAVNAQGVDGETPLHVAAQCGNPDAIRLLLAAGAQVNARGVDGETPLHGAAQCGKPEAIRLLLAAGADVNAKLSTAGIRYIEGMWGHRKVEVPAGDTPLHRAARNVHADALGVLLSAGADVNARDTEGKTALDRAWRPAALRAGIEECRELLRNAGGKTGAELDAEKPAGAGAEALRP